ncbi:MULTISPECIES: ferrochelatase [unclassified Imperialibacter]|uniref:ferrochelatase n=1 Tax=unclassified Imperialibacter TaxID=2629706 RepID=UPI001252AEE2|nr:MULTISPECIES: ferrochelatase [unclassified Imperialibacter]CAD5270245.1 Ferrochelatase [Imperialibacter sp. 89]CAD5298093.1 Ferrochelatase [Imperialibacter sp. 75]VVT34285.1 Ferrochelatase [Imperialibacter sp. EC-SDR9]
MNNKKGKKGVLLVNLGTPDQPDTPNVRKYLREFLMDGRVIDIPFVQRWMLINFIIAPFRAPKSAAEYQKLWDERGSPLKYYGEDVRDLLQKELTNDYVVALAMRYQNPSIASGLEELKKAHVSEIIVVPLFPQYASASTGSVADKVMELVRKWQIIPNIRFINQFADDPLFIEVIAQRAKKWMEQHDYDHYLFSYHGLPERQILKGSVGSQCQLGKCCNSFHDKNRYCYRAQCFLTSRLIAESLGIPEDKYTVAFQSRLGKTPWIQPYTDEKLVEFAEKGYKKVLAFSPAFVSDCLETTVEVGETYHEQFLEAGGERWDLVESLNDHPLWIQCLKNLVLEKASEVRP